VLVSRLIIGFHLTLETRVQNALDDVTGDICIGPSSRRRCRWRPCACSRAGGAGAGAGGGAGAGPEVAEEEEEEQEAQVEANQHHRRRHPNRHIPGGAVQVNSIITHVESAYGFSA